MVDWNPVFLQRLNEPLSQHNPTLVRKGPGDYGCVRDVTTLWHHRHLKLAQLTYRTTSSPNGQSHSCVESSVVALREYRDTFESHSVLYPSGSSMPQPPPDLVMIASAELAILNPVLAISNSVRRLDRKLTGSSTWRCWCIQGRF